MNNLFLVTLGSVTFLGAFFGLGLAFAARKFAVEIDPRQEKLEQVLPAANCGACGYTGCSAFAQAIIDGEAEVGGCPVGGSETASQIAEIMGLSEESESDVQVARLYCQGTRAQAKELCEYRGIETCAGAEIVEGGFKACRFGCLGLGDCVEACPFDAIRISDEGIAVIDEELCTACGKCVEACPRALIELAPEEGDYHVLCCSTESGKKVRGYCEIGCIGCGLCVKECPFDAITMEDSLAHIDYEKCRSCGLCAKKCPTGAIPEK